MINRLSTLFELQLIDDELDTLEELRGDLPLAVNDLNSQIQSINETINSKTEEKESAHVYLNVQCSTFNLQRM